MSTGLACPPPILFFLANDGAPISGGFLAPTVGGVPTAVYQDAALTTPLPLVAIPNQSVTGIPLNSRGEISSSAGVSQQCFLTPGVVYTFTLYDSNGNQVNQAQSVGLAVQSSGWGTPTGAAVQNDYSGGAATLAETSAALAELITVLKTLGILGA